jgi:hypothetical protein
MPVERHLVGAGRFRDRLHADRPDAMPVKQFASRSKDAAARGQPAILIGT